MIVHNWKAILTQAYSMRLMLAAGGSAVISAIQTENPYSIIAAVLAFGGMIARVVIQPVLQAEHEIAKCCINKI